MLINLSNTPSMFQQLAIEESNSNIVQLPSMELKYHQDFHGISIAAPHLHQIHEATRLIASGVTLEIDNVSKFFTLEDDSSIHLKFGCLYQASLPLPSYDSRTILVRLHGKTPAMDRYALNSDDLLEDESTMLTFRIADSFGVFIVSTDNEIIDFTTDVTKVEVIYV